MIGLDCSKFKNGEIAVNCKTEEDANKFLKEYDSRGYVWSGGTGLLELNNWSNYRNETCYRVTGNKKLSYCDTGYYKSEENIEVVEYADFIKEPVENNDMGQLIKQLKKIMNDTEIDVIRAKGIMIVTDEKIIKGL